MLYDENRIGLFLASGIQINQSFRLIEIIMAKCTKRQDVVEMRGGHCQ